MSGGDEGDAETSQNEWQRNCLQAERAIGEQLPILLPTLTNPNEDADVREVVAHIVAYYPNLDESLKLTEILLRLFDELAPLPFPGNTDPIQ